MENLANYLPTEICGIDEAGRGALAGPVYAACVSLPADFPALNRLKDSKKLKVAERNELKDMIIRTANYGVGSATVEEIDRLNILQATFLAMQRAFYNCQTATLKIALIDGNQAPQLPILCQTIVRGDNIEKSIMAASILAKVFRDEYMCNLAITEPRYLFEKHKGYGTKAHIALLKEHKQSQHHRTSFHLKKR